MSTLKDRLAEAMREAPRKIRKTDLWKAAKVSSGAVTQWFDGTVKSMAWEHAQKIAPELGVSAQWLYNGQGPKRVTNAAPISPSGNLQKAKGPANSTPPTITYEVIRGVVAGALQGLGVSYEDLVEDERTTRLRIEAALSRKPAKKRSAVKPKQERVTISGGYEAVTREGGVKDGSEEDRRKKKPA